MTTTGSTKCGKNSTRRIASAAVLWLLLAMFANQCYVLCESADDGRSQMLQQSPPSEVPLSFQSLQSQQQPPYMQPSPLQTQNPTQFGTNFPQQSQFGASPQTQFGTSDGPTRGPQQQDSNLTLRPSLNKQVSIQYDGQLMSSPAVDYPQNQILPQFPQMPQIMQQQNLRRPNVYQSAPSFQMPGNGNSVQSPNPPVSNSANNQNPLQYAQSMPQKLGNAFPIESTMNLINPMQYAQQATGMANDKIGKVRDYSTAVKNGVGSVVLDTKKKMFETGQTLAHGLANVITVVPDMLAEKNRKEVDMLASLFNIPQPQSPSRNSGGSSQKMFTPNLSNFMPNLSNDNFPSQTGQGYPSQMGGNQQMGGNYPNQMTNEFRPMPTQPSQYPQVGGYSNPSQMGGNYGNPTENQYRLTSNQYQPSAAGSDQISMGVNRGQRQDYSGYAQQQQQPQQQQQQQQTWPNYQ